jgi:hypothetical protein
VLLGLQGVVKTGTGINWRNWRTRCNRISWRNWAKVVGNTRIKNQEKLEHKCNRINWR